MIKTALQALVISALLLHSASADTSTGFGAPDCGEWINSPSAAKRAWLLGYLTGMNIYYDSRNDKLVDDPLSALTSAEQAFLWMDNYCKNNPLKDVNTGATWLFVELIKKKVGK